ncbi:MAG: hypothetical protein KME19_07840 [Microcoleus vaginatus WJT46-NPBG5]|jgi:hypothetical protein|nr:hypothetical protein [Microcoleus vaginatus WJT46-NPBG5]
MKIQAMDVQIGDRILAYCHQRRQTCTVQEVLQSTQNNITLTVSTAMRYRRATSCVVQFRRDAFVELAV